MTLRARVDIWTSSTSGFMSSKSGWCSMRQVACCRSEAPCAHPPAMNGGTRMHDDPHRRELTRDSPAGILAWGDTTGGRRAALAWLAVMGLPASTFGQVTVPSGARRPGDGVPANRPDAQGRSRTWSMLSRLDLVRALQGGGYVLIFRHGRTDWSTSDQLPQRSFDDRQTQRNLSEEGREQGRRTGEVFRALGIRFGEVYSSPYFRARDFAELVTGRQPVVTLKLLGYNQTGISGHRELLSEVPASGTNTFLSGHQFAVTELGFVRMNELEEGSCLVFKAHGDENRLEIVAHLNHGDLLGLRGVPP